MGYVFLLVVDSVILFGDFCFSLLAMVSIKNTLSKIRANHKTYRHVLEIKLTHQQCCLIIGDFVSQGNLRFLCTIKIILTVGRVGGGGGEIDTTTT